jgi:hypothetical protein
LSFCRIRASRRRLWVLEPVRTRACFSDGSLFDRLRREVSRGDGFERDASPAPDAEQLLIAKRWRELLDQALAQLSDTHRAPFGTSELALNAALLEGAYLDTLDRVHATGDLDGDGLNELLLRTEELGLHLFYGAPDLFEAGFDFDRADAVLRVSAASPYVFPIGDRDADGTDELLDSFSAPNPLSPFATDVAIANGSQQRLSGSFSFPESEVVAQTPGGRFPSSPERVLDVAIPAGDLDGDGAADLFTLSKTYKFVDDGGLETGSPQLHIHYGTPGAAPLR